MGGLSGEHHGVFTAGPAFANGVIIAVKVVKSGVRQPGFIKVQGFYFAVEQIFYLLHVIENAVVGGLGNGQHPRLDVRVLCQNFPAEGVGFHLLTNAGRLELTTGNGADNAVMVAGGHQKHWHGTCHHNGVQNRLVTVAVYHHDITRGHRGVPYDFVGSRGAIGHEKQVIGIKNAGCVTLRGRYRAGMIQQLP